MTARTSYIGALHVALVVAVTAGVTPVIRAQTLSPTWTGITYLSGASVYLEVGTKDGVRVGTRFEVVRGGAVIASLVAEYVSSSRTACSGSDPAVALAVGDSVRYTPAAPVQSPANSMMDAQPAATSRMHTATPPAIRGRLGIRYLVMDPGTGIGSVLTQPAFDLRLDGQHIGNTPMGIAVDVRAQRSMFGKPAGGGAPTVPANRTRVYQAAILVNAPGSATRLTVGRQFATALSTMGIFDGIALDVDHSRTSYGALAGVEPDAINLGVSTTTREYGAYLQFHNRPAASPLWSFTLGGVGAYQKGHIDREFAYLRTTFNSRRFSLFAAQEIDINRGWKSAQEGGSVATPTSTFAIAQVSLSDALSLYGGMDNRRNVRLYRDYQNPEIAFDDGFRQGIWGGTSLNLFRRLRMSADVRTSSGGTAGDATSYTGSLSVTRITRLQGALHARVTRFTGLVSEGRLQSASAEFHPFGPLRVEFTAGMRVTTHPLDATTATRMTWTGIDADIGISRSLYLMFSTSRETGALDHTLLSYASLSWRF